MHVLIIEDEPLVALQIRYVLEDERATSFAFADTQEAAIEAALLNPPEVIISDVKLVNGTGPCAVEAIHQHLGNVPVIFVTATPDDCVPCAPPGQILCKPVDEVELAAVFNDLKTQRQTRH